MPALHRLSSNGLPERAAFTLFRLTLAVLTVTILTIIPINKTCKHFHIYTFQKSTTMSLKMLFNTPGDQNTTYRHGSLLMQAVKKTMLAT